MTDMTFTEAMEAAVAERGEDWTYPEYDAENADYGDTNWHYDGGTCRYVTRDEKEPACIIGLALTKMGLPPEKIDMRTGALNLLGTLNVATGAERQAARYAQSKQDAGRSWGEALAAYHGRLEEATITQEQYQRLIEGTMAEGPFYKGDADIVTATIRVTQMLSRAGITVQEPNKYKDETLQRVLINLKSGEQMVVVEITPGEWVYEALRHGGANGQDAFPPESRENTTPLELKED